MVTEKAKAKKKKNQWSRKVQMHIHIKSYTCPIVTRLSENIYVWVEASCPLNCKKRYQIHQDLVVNLNTRFWLIEKWRGNIWLSSLLLRQLNVAIAIEMKCARSEIIKSNPFNSFDSQCTANRKSYPQY